MANGIFTIQTTGTEVKGKEVKVITDGVLNEETGEIVKFADLYKPFADQYINFSIKVTEKVEDKFEVPENDDDTEDEE
jgi:hypothetical protein